MWKLNLAKNIVVIQKQFYKIYKKNIEDNKMNSYVLYSNFQSSVFILKILRKQNYK